MNNMKTILNEWRTFIKESDEPYHTSHAAAANKYLAGLKSSRDMSKKEATKKELAYHIVSALAGFNPKEKFNPKNQQASLDVLETLMALAKEFDESGDASNEYFSIYLTGAQKEKRGSRAKDTGVSYILTLADLASHKASFDASEDLHYYVSIMSDMLEDGDSDFGLFKRPTERKRFFDTKERSFGMGTGGVQKPPNLSRQEEVEFEKMSSPWFQASRDVLSILDRTNELTKKEWYNILLREAEAAVVFFDYLEKLWSRKTDPTAYFNDSMIYNYRQTVDMAKDQIVKMKSILANIQPTAEETVEDLMAKARAGDKEAAKEARKMLVSLKRSKEAREMRMLSR